MLHAKNKLSMHPVRSLPFQDDQIPDPIRPSLTPLVSTTHQTPPFRSKLAITLPNFYYYHIHPRRPIYPKSRDT